MKPSDLRRVLRVIGEQPLTILTSGKKALEHVTARFMRETDGVVIVTGPKGKHFYLDADTVKAVIPSHQPQTPEVLT